MKLPNDLIRQIDAARQVGVSKQYINQLVHANKLQTYTVAKLVSSKEVQQLSKKPLDAVK